MYPQTTKFNNALIYSHTAIVRVEVYAGIGGPLIWRSDDIELSSGLLDGEITVQDGSIRRRANLRLIDPVGGMVTPATVAIDTSGNYASTLWDDALLWDDDVFWEAAFDNTYDEDAPYDEADTYDGIVRTTIAQSIPDVPETPLEDIFHPFGNEVRAYRGIEFVDGTQEYIPLGVFGIADVSIDDSGHSLILTVDGFDRSRAVSRATLIQDYRIPAGTLYTTAIENLLRDRVPGLTFNFISMSYVTPDLTVPTGADPWKTAQEMATAIGCELFFDVDGSAVLRTIPNYSIAPVVWSYKEGAEAILLYTNKRSNSEKTYNYYIVTGENSANPVPIRGDAYDDNPRSLTYWKGTYGVVPAPIVATKLVTSDSMAQQASRALLQKGIGRSQNVHFNAIVNPGHDIGDVVEVVRERSKINARYVVAQISMPLSKDRAMDIVTRVRQSVDADT